MGAKMTTRNRITGNTATNTLVSLPVEIFGNILEYLDWGDVGRLDTAFLNRDTRNSYLFVLQSATIRILDPTSILIFGFLEPKMELHKIPSSTAIFVHRFEYFYFVPVASKIAAVS